MCVSVPVPVTFRSVALNLLFQNVLISHEQTQTKPEKPQNASNNQNRLPNVEIPFFRTRRYRSFTDDASLVLNECPSVLTENSC